MCNLAKSFLGKRNNKKVKVAESCSCITIPQYTSSESMMVNWFYKMCPNTHLLSMMMENVMATLPTTAVGNLYGWPLCGRRSSYSSSRWKGNIKNACPMMRIKSLPDSQWPPVACFKVRLSRVYHALRKNMYNTQVCVYNVYYSMKVYK